MVTSVGGAVRWTDIRPDGDTPILVLPGLSIPVDGLFDQVIEHPGLADR